MSLKASTTSWPPEASRLRLLYLDIRIWLGRRFIAQTSGKRNVIDIGFGQICQRYACETGQEPKAMEYIRQYTSIPVPEVHGAWLDTRDDFAGPSCTFIMERIEGETLLECWNALSGSETAALAVELGGYIEEMRALQQPAHLAGQICSVDGQTLCDGLVSEFDSGPFSSLDGFLDYYTSDIRKRPRLEKHKPADDYLVLLKEPRHAPIVFTHGDLQPRNIIVRKGMIVGIVDWRQAGWMPIYWEYAKAQTPWKGVIRPEAPKGWDNFTVTVCGPFQGACAALIEIWNSTSFR